MSRAKRIFTNWRVLLLIAFIVLSILAINPKFSTDGVAIRQVLRESSAADGGMQSPAATLSPTARERVLAVNGIPVTDMHTYYATLKDYPANQSVTVTTNRATYVLTTPALLTFDANGTVNGTQEIADGAVADLGIIVYEAPTNNIKLGLDLSGGTRVILKPKERVSPDDLNIIIENIKQRLNVFGLSDIVVRAAKDLDGDDFIIVEIAGANKDEVQELLSRQGKFEAKVGNTSVFRGGQDITSVCRTAECSGLSWNRQSAGCGQSSDGGQVCQFSFQITLSPEAAQRQADATRNLPVEYDGAQSYLSEPLTLYLDDEEVDSLQIAADLKGRTATTIVISGSGAGQNLQAAQANAITNMKKLQTVLITGSLPVQLEIIKSDGISPVLGAEFIDNAILIGILSIIAVTLVLIIRYRKAIIAVPIVITMLAEVTIILGFASWVGWNLDLASIAAIIIAIGSGVDDQIVIIDETLHGGVDKKLNRSWKERIGTAFFIIFASYFTLTSAMIPLWFAGAGLLRGFAITTIIGITAGAIITRPAFAVLVENIIKKDDDE
jgi:preprotein translocase subunit SecD